MGWRDDARRAARRYGLPENYFINQMGQEAHGEDLVSPAGAQGPAQIMPATAQAWGLSPADVHNRLKAYDAAAKHMAAYVKQFGSFKDALVAYNAGPGRVGGSLPSETRNYIATIMRGDPGGSGAPTGGGGGGAAPGPSRAPGGGQQDNIFSILAALNRNLPKPGGQTNPMDQTLQQGWDLLAQLSGGQQSQGNPLQMGIQPGGGGGGLGHPGKGAIRKGLHEAFYDPVGGYDEGKSIGPIGGHDDHIHFGGMPAAIAAIVRRAQRRGLNVREYNPVDKVDPVHTQGSWHYRYGGRGGADISGSPEQMAAFYRRMLRRAGWR